tara:strand:- start:1659 stop:1976 length:318 start_codon:yes stop_codon:yes gene_type:complete
VSRRQGSPLSFVYSGEVLEEAELGRLSRFFKPLSEFPKSLDHRSLLLFRLQIDGSRQMDLEVNQSNYAVIRAIAICDALCAHRFGNDTKGDLGEKESCGQLICLV